MVKEHTQNRCYLFDTTLQSMASSECFKAVVSDDTNIVLLISKRSVNIDCDLLTSAEKLSINVKEIRRNTIH